MAADRREVAGFREEADVEAIAGERLHEWSSSAVLDRGESQIVYLIEPTLAGRALHRYGYFRRERRNRAVPDRG